MFSYKSDKKLQAIVSIDKSGVLTHKRLWGRMVFEKEKFSRLNKLRLLQVSLTFQHTSKVNSSDNNLK
jgi:hypothetical protein